MKVRNSLVFIGVILGLAACSGPETQNGDGEESGDAIEPEMLEPIQVFLMAGQSNMVGYGPLSDADTGDWPESLSLDAMIDAGTASAQLLATRDDVWVAFQSTEEVKGAGLLEPGFGGSEEYFGPELGLGEVLGEALDTPLVFFKSATGGTTLGSDWRPPSAVTRAGGSVGPLYTNMMTGFSDFIQMNLNATFAAEYASRGFKVAGFIWLQGWNDQFEDGFVEAYEDNLVDLVHDVRAGLELPQLPVFVVEGPTLDEPLRQARLAALARLDSENPGAQVLIETRDLVNIDVEGNFHFNFNASNYLEVGRRMAAAVLERR
jgi:alpha-galactosidase